jgi:hypothetical protein
MNTSILLKLDEKPAIHFSTIDELDKWLDNYAVVCSSNLPVIVTIYVNNFELGIGLGFQESFVHVEDDSGNGPYFITVGENQSDDVATFFLHGHHHTEIPVRHLIPIVNARTAVRDFIISGKRTQIIQWEEV